MMTALMMPLIMLVASAGVDFQRWGQQRAQLQEFADMLALRGAREYLLADARASAIESVVESIARGSVADDLDIGAFSIDVVADLDNASVRVRITQPPRDTLLLSHFSPYGDELSVDSTAVARGGMNVCVVALEDRQAGAVSVDGDALLDATPCSILSNSTSSNGVVARQRAEMRAGLICSAGGASGSSSNFTPAPTTDCPVYEDPLAHRTAPPVGSCNYHNFEVGYILSQSTGSGGGGSLIGGVIGGVGGLVETVGDLAQVPLIEQTISPGVYCGGLKIKKKARVTFRPGVYVIKNGPLEVGEQSTLQGDGIAFHLYGDASTFFFERESEITMSAPKTGLFAGILFFEDRSAPLNRVHRIQSNNARKFLGTFYLPRGVLEVDTQRPVADVSAYTAIVARALDLKGAPTLVLNADYASTDVPVPAGVGPVGGEVFLRD